MASVSGVSIPTIKRLEAADGDLGGRATTGEKIVFALEAAGVEFLNHGQPGVRLKAKPKPPRNDGNLPGWTEDPDEADRMPT